MVAKYVPKGGNGGARKGAGRPLGSLSAQARNAIKQAVQSGPLGHFLLLEWAQSGIMKQPKTEIRLVPVLKGGAEVSKKNLQSGKLPREKYVMSRREVVVRDDAGKIVYEDVVLDPYVRMACAIQASPYFAAKLAAKGAGASDPDPEAEMWRRANQLVKEARTPLPALPAPSKTVN